MMGSPTTVADPTEKTGPVVTQPLWAPCHRKRPLTLLDLPFDILQLIIQNMTLHDLTLLVLTNTTLYNLVIPHIYSRFDIAWPESRTAASGHKGIYDLILGLSTVFVESTFARQVGENYHRDVPRLPELSNRNHGQYTKSLSIGYSPEKLVAEYMVYKTGGMMLGTLVASAISRMNNLEAFSWDMPTGVLPSVFEALGSLAHQPAKTCKLSSVRVRWHDSTKCTRKAGALGLSDEVDNMALVPQGTRATPIGLMLPPGEDHPSPPGPVLYSEYHCGYPTFSVLPPLKKLAVLDIDEIGYLDEMAVLIGRSKDILQELSVGISSRALNLAFAYPWDGPGLEQIDHGARWPGESNIGVRRLGGVLGVLVGNIYDIPKRELPDQPASSPKCSNRKCLEGKLKLQKLVLERVPLSIHVCRYAFDWSVLTNLTLLSCGKLDKLWKMLRRHFRPTQMCTTFSFSSTKRPSVNVMRKYHLALKVIHTDTTSLPLINFIKDTLAPNSLEGLFLRYRPGSGGFLLPLNTIFNGAIKPHHESLRRVFLRGHGMDWTVPTKMSLYLTSGRMKNLRELSVAMKYKDWHTFLRRLPNLPQLRVLHIQKMRAHPMSRITELFEFDFASQIIDIISLRPAEVGLRYFGIGLHCFEILEASAAAVSSLAGGDAGGDGGGGGGAGAGLILSAWDLDVWASVEDSLSSFEEEEEEEDEDEEDEEDEFGDGDGDGVGVGEGGGQHALFVDAVSSGEDEEEDVDSETEDGDDGDGDDEEEEEEEDDGFVEPESESVRFELRKVEFSSVQADIFRVMFGEL